MPRAVWRGATLAESDYVEVVDGYVYFPPETVNMEYLRESDTRTTCSWKGEARYYTIEVDGHVNEDAAWVYPDPKEAAHNIHGFIAFWKGVDIVD